MYDCALLIFIGLDYNQPIFAEDFEVFDKIRFFRSSIAERRFTEKRFTEKPIQQKMFSRKKIRRIRDSPNS